MNPDDLWLPPTISVSIPLAGYWHDGSVEHSAQLAEAQSQGESIAGGYERLLVWYPKSWRTEYGPAMVGALLDQAEASGRSKPTISDRLSLAAGGIRARLSLDRPSSWAGRTAMVAASAFSIFYVFVISWSPGFSGGGSLLWFSNPSALAGALIIVATILALNSRDFASRVFALIAIVVEATTGVLATSLGWMGPSWGVVLFFVGLAGFGIAGFRTARTMVWAFLILVATTAAVVLLPSFANQLSAYWQVLG